jgi:hypothetical protein
MKTRGNVSSNGMLEAHSTPAEDDITNEDAYRNVFFPEGLGGDANEENYVSVGVAGAPRQGRNNALGKTKKTRTKRLGSANDVDDPLVQLLPNGEGLSAAPGHANSQKKPASLAGPAGWRQSLEQKILPAIRRFQPELIFISSGFDGCYMDPLGGRLGLRPSDFRWGTRKVLQLAKELPCCNGRVVSVLEGGYDAGRVLFAQLILQKVTGVCYGIAGSSRSGLVQCVEAHVLALQGL